MEIFICLNFMSWQFFSCRQQQIYEIYYSKETQLFKVE
jgi:hypothetical protein